MMKRVFFLVVLTLVVVSLAVQANVILRVGATPVPHAEILEFIRPLLLEQGIELKIREFNDYVQPNLALAHGELDANFFQHIPYLETFKKDHQLHLTYIAAVHIEPLGLYSKKIDKISQLTKGAVIALPNDPSNGGRALHLLQENGLITLDDSVGLAATPLDITKNPLKLKFIELEAAQLPRALDDLTGAIINTNYAFPAGLHPLRDALIIEGSTSPYVNILAVQEKKIDPKLKILAEILVSDRVKEFIIQRYGGAVVPAQSLNLDS